VALFTANGDGYMQARSTLTSSVFPILKSINYIKQILHVMATSELSEMQAGKGLVIVPHSGRQPQSDVASDLQETIILSVTGDILLSQGDVSEAGPILSELLEKLHVIMKKLDTRAVTHEVKLAKFAEVAVLIAEARLAIGERVSACPNRDKVNTYLRTLEVNLKHYDFLQKAGVHYLGRDSDYADEKEEEKLTKEKLARIDNISVKNESEAGPKLYTLSRKGRVQAYIYDSEDDFHYISASDVIPFLKNRPFRTLLQAKTPVQDVKISHAKALLWERFLSKEVSGIDAIHKIWVNSSPSHNPYSHELLMLCEKGRVKGYVHINVLHDVLSYIPKAELNDYLVRDNRTVMGVQALPILDMQACKQRIQYYAREKWLAGGFVHNCANFTDDIAHAGGVSYAELSPSTIGHYDAFQYPLERLNKLEALATKEHGLDNHISHAKACFKEQAKREGITQEKRVDYVKYRCDEGLSHEKAQHKVEPSKAAPSLRYFLAAHETVLKVISALNPLLFIVLFPFAQASELTYIGSFFNAGKSKESKTTDLAFAKKEAPTERRPS
jgi:hypothetical protein